MELSMIDLTKRYKQKTALNDFSLTLTSGVWGLLGPNGAGKTTMMNIVAGVLRRTSGSVLWNGEDIDAMGERYRDILGYLPQEPGLYKDFTARMFLRYMAALKGVCCGRGERRAREGMISELLERVNLLGDADGKIGAFSGGMKRRLGIAQALINDPRLLILDEPTAGLDPQERVRFRNLLSTIAFDKIVIWATHIVSDVESISHEVILIREGHLIGKGSASALTEGLRGKVWTVSLPIGEADDMRARCRVTGVTGGDREVALRLISDVSPHPLAAPVDANLEDLYLSVFGGRVDA